MKICYTATDVVIPHYRGASTHVYEVAKHLTHLGHEVHVISRRVSYVQPKYENFDGIRVHRIFRGLITPLLLASYERLEMTERKIPEFMHNLYAWYLFSVHAVYAGLITSSIIKTYNIDIIIERETCFGAGAIASAITKRPLILEIVGPRYSKYSLKKSKKVITYTRALIRDPVPFEKLETVTAAADIDNFKPQLKQGQLVREKYNLQNLPVVGYIGTFAKWHGIEDLISASERILKTIPTTRFLMVGPYFKAAKRLTEEKNISNAYVFTGPVPYIDVPKYINAADILVAPYNPARSELRRKYGLGSPLKVFEYMACGKPVITTSVEPITQVVQNRKTGILIPPDNPKALAEAIIYLIVNPSIAKEIGNAARVEVEKNFSWKALATQLENVLQETLRSSN